MAFRDNLKIADLARVGLAETPEDQHFLPEEMTCPQGHLCHRHFQYQDSIEIPYYACTPCALTYRYHELSGYERLKAESSSKNMPFRHSLKIATVPLVGIPATLQCPQGHFCSRQFCVQDEIAIPFFACTPCTVAYRYEECTS